MSLWISSLKQLEPARHLFTPLLWDFMEAAWPSPISLVIPRGEETLLWRDLGLEFPKTLSPCHPRVSRRDIPATATVLGLVQISDSASAWCR